MVISDRARGSGQMRTAGISIVTFCFVLASHLSRNDVSKIESDFHHEFILLRRDEHFLLSGYRIWMVHPMKRRACEIHKEAERLRVMTSASGQKSKEF